MSYGSVRIEIKGHGRFGSLRLARQIINYLDKQGYYYFINRYHWELTPTPHRLVWFLKKEKEQKTRRGKFIKPWWK